jgi:hypothetical protein
MEEIKCEAISSEEDDQRFLEQIEQDEFAVIVEKEENDVLGLKSYYLFRSF